MQCRSCRHPRPNYRSRQPMSWVVAFYSPVVLSMSTRSIANRLALDGDLRRPFRSLCIRFDIPTIRAPECPNRDELLGVDLVRSQPAFCRIARVPARQTESSICRVRYKSSNHLRLALRTVSSFIQGQFSPGLNMRAAKSIVALHGSYPNVGGNVYHLVH